jgi:hypothetical protein
MWVSVKGYFVKPENLIKFVKCFVTCGVPKFVRLTCPNKACVRPWDRSIALQQERWRPTSRTLRIKMLLLRGNYRAIQPDCSKGRWLHEVRVVTTTSPPPAYAWRSHRVDCNKWCPMRGYVTVSMRTATSGAQRMAMTMRCQQERRQL